MKYPMWHAVALSSLVLVVATPGRIAAQVEDDRARHEQVLAETYPELHDVLLRLERIHGVLFARLADEGDVVRASEDDFPTFEFEFEMIDRLIALAHEEGTLDHVAEEATEGYELLGPRAAAIIEWTNGFHREVLGIMADPGVGDRRAVQDAVAKAVERYRSRPELALPVEPKDMDILYEHPYALDFRSGYADLDGVIWAGHWLTLAATEPLIDLTDPAARAAGVDTVRTRYYSKLSFGEPPQFFPSEIPLAPAIAPGLIWMSAEAAIIWDNLTMMQEVLADVLASPDVDDVQAAIEWSVDLFMDPTLAMTDQDDWEIMALRHGIFFQGGYPLGVMTESERNVGGHAAHLGATGGGAPVIDPRMLR